MGAGRALLALGIAATAIVSSVASRAPAGIAMTQTAAATSAPTSLGLGSGGPRVHALQHRLIALGYLPAGAASGVYDMRTWHAVVAFEGWQRLPRDGVVEPRTRTALRSAARPRPWARLPSHALELDLRRQVLLVVHRGRTVRAVHISSAALGRYTPRGRFRVYRRERLSWSAPYQVWMPYALYFTGGYAVHGFGLVPAYPASHGCVRMPLSDAPFVYAATPLGTPVVIR